MSHFSIPRSFGIDDAEFHFRRSTTSVRAAARVQGVDLDASEKFSSEAEYSISAAALVVLLVHWACISAQVKADETLHRAAKAKTLLHTLSTSLLGGGKFAFQGHYSGLRIKIENGNVYLSHSFSNSPLNRFQVARCDQCDLTSGLVSVGTLCAKFAKTTDDQKQVAALYIRDIAWLMALRFQAFWKFPDDEGWAADLPTLRLRTNRFGCVKGWVSLFKGRSGGATIASARCVCMCVCL